MQIYGLKNCDTCRKAKKALPDAEFLDVRVDGIDDEILKTAFKSLGDALVNKKSTTWRGLDDVEKEKEPMMLINEYPALMKRPLIQFANEGLILGWSEEVRLLITNK